MRRFRSNILVRATGMALLAAAMLPGAVSASYSWYGANYSFDSSSWSYVWACDGESDGNGAYAKYDRNGASNQRVDDPNGSQTGCGGVGPFSPVYRHHICESQFWSDPCGSWVYNPG